MNRVRREYKVGLVTFYHPEWLILHENERRGPDYCAIPHRCYREDPCESGFFEKMRDLEALPTGEELQELKGWFDGAQLLSLLEWEPRLVHVDPPPQRPKWKVELRGKNGWREREVPLSDERRELFDANLVAARWRVTGVWVNPPAGRRSAPEEWVNIVFGPQDKDIAPAPFELLSRDGHLWIQWPGS